MRLSLRKAIWINRVILLLAAGNIITGACQAKEHAWREGKLLDTKSESFATYDGRKGYTEHRFAIEEGRYVYITSVAIYDHNIHAPFYVYSFPLSKQPKVTVNAPIKFALEGDKVYIVDEAGREHKLKLEKRILKTP